ncbi:KRI1-like family C-terminal-domain-containing protein [Helicostylum pulchrum]|uniref:Kri1-like C-terminal domain-containing protein n=1 Tax=Helicostylum pulchrum TaxID=562976 RepID=A0ABP9XZD4_9FUNG|nr:KRI1-like family C-terminal-domain-containing protein [Helicostylum pulchrum]
MDSFGVQIRERDDPSQDYKRPELLKKATEEIEAEVAALAEKEASSEDDSSSYDSDEDEDDDANLLTPAVDSQIFRTIAAIQAKDPRVYKDDTKFFEKPAASSESTPVKKEVKEKEIKLKDYERQILLENGGYVDEWKEGATGKTHREEQEELRNAFKQAGDESSDEESEDDFLIKKDKTSEEKEAEENDYKKFLLQHMKDDEPSKKAFEALTNYKKNPNVNPEEAFLMDYVLNRGWVDKKTEKVPVVEDIEEDEKELDDIDRFESKYNFRFEEEGANTIKTYARDVEGTVRRKQSKRAKRREREKLHKAALKEKQMELIKQQKNQKRKEIEAKLKEISGITGVENIDLEADYDPAMFDAQMNTVFDDSYYGGVEGEENVKPEWDDDIETGLPEDVDMMDADYLPGGEKYEEKAAVPAAAAVPDEERNAAKQKIDNLLEEYYALNYEDVIGGDLFTRFKYTKTEPEDYGLTPEEILLADDAELNKYIGIKSLAP